MAQQIILYSEIYSFTKRCVQGSVMVEMIPSREIEHFCEDVLNVVDADRFGPNDGYVWMHTLYRAIQRVTENFLKKPRALFGGMGHH